MDDKTNKNEIIHPVESSFESPNRISFKIDNNNYSTWLIDRLKTKKEVTKIGQLDGNLNHIFSGIDQVLIKNEFIYLLDQDNVSISKFDLQGEFITSIGKSGDGPGEYKQPTSINAYNNDLFITDRLFSIIKAKEINKTDYELTNYYDFENTLESACISNHNLIVKSIIESDSKKDNLLTSFDLSTKSTNASFGEPYSAAYDPFGRELLSEGIIGCNKDGIYLAKYILPYIYNYNQEGKLAWISEIDSYNPMKFKESVGEGMSFRWNNDNLLYSEYKSFHFLENKLILQVQNYSNNVNAENSVTKALTLETYSIDTKNGSGEYLGNDIPEIYFLDEDYLVIKGNTDYPSMVLYML